MVLLDKITSIILIVLFILILYKFLYYIIGFLSPSVKFPETDKLHKFAVVISARNEETVIGNLLDSLNDQDYPKELLTVFVVADNCDDNTAIIAREKGAVVYERLTPPQTKRRKGYALEFLFERIEEDYGINSFEAYQIFDADNVVSPDYFKEVNKAFDTGADAVCGYLHSKNYDKNFISASYGMHFCRTMLSMHRPRTRLGTSTHFNGTGVLIKSDYLKNGWHCTCMTEDTEMCTEIAAQGGKVVACESATFFDEQPIDVKTCVRQRLRWTKGRLAAFFLIGYKLITGLFTNKLSRKWACYDLFFYLFPYSLFTLIISAVYPVTSTIISLINGVPLPVMTWLKAAGIGLLTTYVGSLIEGVLILIREQKHIYCSKGKQILYLFGWPLFDLISIPLTILCLFVKVKWKTIKHVDTDGIEKVEAKKQLHIDEEKIQTKKAS